jgi:ComEC/Rec2-related protein
MMDPIPDADSNGASSDEMQPPVADRDRRFRDAPAHPEGPSVTASTRRLPFLLPVSFLVGGLAAGYASPTHQVNFAAAGLAAAAGAAAFARREARLGLIVLALLFAFGVIRSDRLSEPASTEPQPERPPIAVAADHLPWRVSRFLEAAMLGRREILLPQEREAYRKAGVTHLLAVSGLNVVVLGGVAWLVFSLVLGDGARADYAAITAIGAYVLGIGAPPSALRSGLMAGLLLFARARGHRGRTLNVLLAAAFLTLLVDPGALFDIGFQLSYAATFGLIGWTRRLERILPLRPRMLASLLATAIAAQAATLPITAWHFREIAPIAFLANIAVIPLFTLAQLLTLAALAHIPLMATAADRIIEAMLHVIEAFARLPGSSFVIARPPLITIASLMALAGASILFPRRVAVAGALGLAAIAGILTRPAEHGIFLVRDGRGAIGMIVVEPGAVLVLDDGVSRAAWRTALSDLGLDGIDSFATRSPTAASSWGGRGLIGEWAISEWRAPPAWERDLELRPALESIRRSGIDVRAGPSRAAVLEYEGRVFAVGDISAESATVSVSRVGRDAARIRAAPTGSRPFPLEYTVTVNTVLVDVRPSAP